MQRLIALVDHFSIRRRWAHWALLSTYQLTTLWFLCRFIRISFWQMNIGHRNCVRHYTLSVRIKWISFKSWDFLPWPSLMLVFFNAIEVSKKSVLDLPNKVMSWKCQRSVWPFQTSCIYLSQWSGLLHLFSLLNLKKNISLFACTMLTCSHRHLGIFHCVKHLGAHATFWNCI